MASLEQIRGGLHRAWDTLARGWRELRERAGEALTRFHPRSASDRDDAPHAELMQRGSRWGLLAAELAESDDEVRVRLEVPGLDADDFEVEVIDHVLRVRGEKHMERDSVHGHYRLMERAFGRFERALALPAAVDDEAAQARYRNGVLEIRLPKTREATRRRIPLQRAS